ncbi:DNA primase [Vibrio phage vB_VcorM_GR11A]|nr:DNA primase [Vibrio phage vB_VcorM_GR11A]
MAKKVYAEADGVSKAHRVILKEIEKIPGYKKYTHKTVEILCPFHAGDSSPSCGIYVAPDGRAPVGWTYCLGCGTSVHWNVLAKKLGLEHIEGKDTKRDSTGFSDQSMNRIRKSLLAAGGNSIGDYMAEWQMPLPLPFLSQEWRGISGALIKEMGCMVGIDRREKEPFLIMPVNVRGKMIAAIKARFAPKDGSPSYVISDDSPLRTKGLFMFDHVRDMLKSGKYKWVVLVEGQRDALRLIQYGIPAVAMLGVSSWSEKKKRLLLSLGVGIVLCMDGDKAGVGAMRQLREDLTGACPLKVMNLMTESKRIAEKKGITVKAAKVDPGSMSLKFIKPLQELNKTSSRHVGKVDPKYVDTASVKLTSDAVKGNFSSTVKVKERGELNVKFKNKKGKNNKKIKKKRTKRW